MKPTFFASAADFRAWLDANHARATEILVGLHKKSSTRPGLVYQEALDEALAYGWIDGVRRRHDEHRWTIRFTPRRSRSIWSTVNVRRMTELVALGRVAPAGMRAFEAREERRTGVYSYELTQTVFDRASAKRFAANKKAQTFFDAQPPGYRRHAAGWVMQAKKEETRLKRLAHLIEISARGKRVDMLKPYA